MDVDERKQLRRVVLEEASCGMASW